MDLKYFTEQEIEKLKRALEEKKNGITPEQIEKYNFQMQNAEMLKKGEATENMAGANAALFGFPIGIVLIVIKVIKHGFVFMIHTGAGGFVNFLIEQLLLLILPQILLYILIKPFDVKKRKAARAELSEEEFAQYQELKSKLSELSSKVRRSKPQNKLDEEGTKQYLDDIAAAEKELEDALRNNAMVDAFFSSCVAENKIVEISELAALGYPKAQEFLEKEYRKAVETSIPENEALLMFAERGIKEANLYLAAKETIAYFKNRDSADATKTENQNQVARIRHYLNNDVGETDCLYFALDTFIFDEELRLDLREFSVDSEGYKKKIPLLIDIKDGKTGSILDTRFAKFDPSAYETLRKIIIKTIQTLEYWIDQYARTLAQVRKERESSGNTGNLASYVMSNCSLEEAQKIYRKSQDDPSLSVEEKTRIAREYFDKYDVWW